MLLIALQVPVAGLYVAQLASTVVLLAVTLFPPATNTFPDDNSTAECSWRFEGIVPVPV